MRFDRKRAYFVLMGTCILLIVLAWTVVRQVSVMAAGVMSVVAMVIPPIAAIVANAGALSERSDVEFEEPRDPVVGPDG